MPISRETKLTIAGRVKRREQQLRRPVDKHEAQFKVLSFEEVFKPDSYIEMKVWHPDGSFEQGVVKGEIIHFPWPN